MLLNNLSNYIIIIYDVVVVVVVVAVVVVVEASAPKVYPRVTLASASTLQGRW